MKVDGIKIKRLREIEGWSAEELAEMVSVSPQTIYRIEREGTAKHSTAAELAKAFKLPVKKLVRVEETP